MHTLFLSVLCAALSCTTSTASDSNDNIEALMDNVLVLKVPEVMGTMVHVPLTCGEAFDNQAVFWKKNGMELKPALQGNQVSVLVEEMDGGNYTCHLSSTGEYLNHTVILIRLDPDNRTVILKENSPEEGHIDCSAPNYKGSFHCTWRRTSFRSDADVLLVKAEQYSKNISCELDADGSGIHCHDTTCPFKEEQHRISLTVYMRSYSRLEAYTKNFYLREIVRPEEVSALSVSDGHVFHWSYPDSWEKPGTFFSLMFEVKVVHNRQPCTSGENITYVTTDKTKFEVNVKTKKYVFCVRAQDRFAIGPFSPWKSCTVKHNEVAC